MYHIQDQDAGITTLPARIERVPKMRCQICLKSGVSGNNVSHSNRHTKTRFKANVHKQTIDRDGTPVTVKICSRCLRSLHKSPKVRKAFAAIK